ncbi:MAG: ankyrin repeat domain-containing protein [Caldilineaceae bacterium]
MTAFTHAEFALTPAVERLAAALVGQDEAILDSRGWSWGDYDGLRLALIGTTQDLDDLAADLLDRRAKMGNPPTVAQRLLAHHHIAYWDLRALLTALDEEKFVKPPAEGEWPVQTTLFHICRAERGFWGSILIGFTGAQEGVARPFDGAQAHLLTGAADPAPQDTDGLSTMTTAYQRLHRALLDDLQMIHDAELDAPSPFWEPAAPSVHFRIGRLTAHLHEHTVQIEKTLAVVAPQTEAHMHVRRLYRALAGVESALLGAPDLGYLCDDLAAELDARVAAVTQAIADIPALFDAIRRGDAGTVHRLLQVNRKLVDAGDANRLSALMTAVYYHQKAIVQILRDAGAELDLFSAAAVGDLPEIEAHYEWNPRTVNWIARDGFTPLQLACFFSQETIVRYLLERGADVHAVSRNSMGLQALHAAVAGRNPAIVHALIAAGADVTARQAGGYTPLQAAQENNDEEITAVLREAGAGE